MGQVTTVSAMLWQVSGCECHSYTRGSEGCQDDFWARHDHYLQTNFTVFEARFEVFMAVTMKNAVFWDVTPCGSCKNRHFGGT
jgi:hypothetical protein